MQWYLWHIQWYLGANTEENETKNSDILGTQWLFRKILWYLGANTAVFGETQVVFMGNSAVLRENTVDFLENTVDFGQMHWYLVKIQWQILW